MSDYSMVISSQYILAAQLTNTEEEWYDESAIFLT
jgi:hypothetical protein